MSAFQITITDAGRAAVINAENTGTAPVTIAQIGFGSGQYTPNKTQTALVSETKRVGSIAGQAVSDDTLHLVAQDESSDSYDVGEFGLFTDAGVLFAVYSQPVGSGWIIEKSAASTLLLAVDVILETLDAASVTFGDASFINPPATETIPGVLAVATQAQTDAGSADNVALTPKKLKAWAKQATETVLGLLKVATQAQTNTGTDDNTAVTPKKLQAWTKQATETIQGLLKVATQAQTDAGTDDATVVTPKKLKAWTKQATETVLGLMKVATQAQTNTGTDDTTAVTPKKLQAWRVALFGVRAWGQNDYVRIPDVPGGLIIQWGSVIASATTTAVVFPTQFPTAVLSITFGDESENAGGHDRGVGAYQRDRTVSGFTLSSQTNTEVMWIAIGY